MPRLALRASKLVPSLALVTQLTALGAPENDFWCPLEPPGLILESPRLFFGRFSIACLHSLISSLFFWWFSVSVFNFSWWFSKGCLQSLISGLFLWWFSVSVFNFSWWFSIACLNLHLSGFFFFLFGRLWLPIACLDNFLSS